MTRKIESLAASSVDSLLTTIRNLASRPIPEFNKFEALELLEALKDAAQDVKHEKTGYFRLTFETLRTIKMSQSNEQFRNFLLPLLGDKDNEKILEIVAKVEKTNRRTHGKQGRATATAPYSVFRCHYCGRPGHIRANCFKRKRDMGEPSGVSPRPPKQSQNRGTQRENFSELLQISFSTFLDCLRPT